MRYHFKTKPYPYQRDIVVRGIRQKHIGLLWEPGTGKTKATIDWLCALYMKGEIERVMVVCPLSVTGVWEDEFADHAPIPYHLHILDTGDRKVPTVKGKLNVLVVNYDRVWRRDKIVQRFAPDAIVADESHRIKKPSARRSRYLRRFNKVPYRAILTGTPTPKSYLDIYAQWVFLNPKRFGTNFNNFKQKYVRFGGYRNYQVMGYLNVQELLDGIKADADIQHKSKDLPPRTYQRVPVELEPAAWKAYEKMAYELFLELNDHEIVDAKNVAVKILRLQQITGGWIKSEEGNLHQLSKAKIDATRERLEDLWNDDERVVVFARFRPEVGAIADLGVRSGVPTYVLSGDTRQQDRDRFRRDFQAKAGPSLFVAQIQTGGLGITLHSAAEVIFYSVTHALDDYIQACDRVHRIGQKRPVRYQHIVARRSIDLDIYANLRAKKNIMDTVMHKPKALARSLGRNLGIDEVS